MKENFNNEVWLERKMSPKAQVFEYLVLVGGTVWGGNGAFQRWSLAGGSTPLEALFLSLSFPLFPSLTPSLLSLCV